jgi:ADP-ribose pyrophosphatase YjhB (NUDIX family)
MKYRVAAKGLLHKEGRILFIEYEDSRGLYYALPGGGQETGENLQATVTREFKEETDIDVVVGDLLMVREFIWQRSDIPGWDAGIHQLEMVFACHQADETQVIQKGDNPDLGMLGVKWIAIADLNNYRIYPTPAIGEMINNKTTRYLFTAEE